MPEVAILYDSSCRCSTATACALEHYLDWTDVALCNLLSCLPEDIQPYNTLILALPIHAFGTPEQPWADAWPILEDVSYQGKRVVLCGTGSDFCFDDDRLAALAALSLTLQGYGAELVEGLADMPMPLLNEWMQKGNRCRWQQTRLIYSENQQHACSTRQQPMNDGELRQLSERIRLAHQGAGALVEQAKQPGLH